MGGLSVTETALIRLCAEVGDGMGSLPSFIGGVSGAGRGEVPGDGGQSGADMICLGWRFCLIDIDHERRKL